MKRSTLLLTVSGFLAVGCFGNRPPRPTAPTDGRPTYENVALTIGCPNAAMAEALKPFVAGWAARTHATVTFQPTAGADVVVLSPSEFGAEAARRAFLPVPNDVKQPGHPFQWSNVLAEKLISWGGQVHGIPLGAGGDVLLFRTDVLRNGRPLTPAVTWEEFAGQAEALSRDEPGRPVLPALPASDAALLHQFHLIAAPFDRLSVTNSPSEVLPQTVVRQASTFHHDLKTGEPRLRTESFVAALTLMKRLQAFRPAGTGDAVAGLQSGQTKMAVLSLTDLGRLAAASNGRIPDHFSIAAIPGTRTALDPSTQKLVPVRKEANVNAYLGDSGFVGAVRTACSNPAAAFDLLTELGGPVTSLKLIADPAFGFGPWRKEQYDAARREVWNGYGLSPGQMTKLISVAQLPYSGAFDNPVYAPRGPDTAPLMAALAGRVRACLTGPTTPEEALAAAEAEWVRIDATFPVGEPKKWRREAVGLPAVE